MSDTYYNYGSRGQNHGSQSQGEIHIGWLVDVVCGWQAAENHNALWYSIITSVDNNLIMHFKMADRGFSMFLA